MGGLGKVGGLRKRVSKCRGQYYPDTSTQRLRHNMGQLIKGAVGVTSDPIISYAYYCLSSAWVGFSFLFLKTAESESESWTDSDTEYITVSDSDDDSFEEAIQHDERRQPHSPTCKKARSTTGRTSSELLWLQPESFFSGRVEVPGHLPAGLDGRDGRSAPIERAFPRDGRDQPRGPEDKHQEH